MEKFQTITSTYVPLPIENVDTDQIIPARFLKATTRDGFGDNLFADWRYDMEGNPKEDFVLNDPTYSGEVLVAGKNFGSGSSREHAAWAIGGYGFRVVVSSFFADIFRNNALKNGLLALVVEPAAHERLLQSAGEALEIDVDAQAIHRPGGEHIAFALDPFTRLCLLEGVDELGYLLQRADAIDAFERARACAT